MDAHTVLICTGKTSALLARRNSGSTDWTRGRNPAYYSDRERAALAWTEAVTKIREGHTPDEVYEETAKQFTEKSWRT